jgi:membrane associated rhomboid family serine protease
MGAYFVMFPRSRVLFLVPARTIVDAVELPALLVAGAWLTPQIAGGLGPLTAPWIGAAAAAVWPILAGLAAGAFGARLGRRPERQRVEWWGA